MNKRFNMIIAQFGSNWNLIKTIRALKRNGMSSKKLKRTLLEKAAEDNRVSDHFS